MNGVLDPGFNGADLVLVLLALAGIGALYLHEGRRR